MVAGLEDFAADRHGAPDLHDVFLVAVGDVLEELGSDGSTTFLPFFDCLEEGLLQLEELAALLEVELDPFLVRGEGMSALEGLVAEAAHEGAMRLLPSAGSREAAACHNSMERKPRLRHAVPKGLRRIMRCT